MDYAKLVDAIAINLQMQLSKAKFNRGLEVVRTSAFTSTRSDTSENSIRMKMIKQFYANNFDVHRYDTFGLQVRGWSLYM